MTPSPRGPALPIDFFSIAELQAMAGSPQRARIIGWLKDSGIPHVIGLHGWPIVYRHNLLPHPKPEAQNDPSVVPFDFAAAHVSRRSPSQRRQS